MAASDTSIPDLIRGAIRDAQDLVRGEIALAKAEAREEVRRLGTGAAMLAGAAVVAVIGLILLLTTMAWAISEGFGWPVWAGFGIITVLTLIGAGVLGWWGMSEVSAQRYMPRTMDTLKENVEWMRARTS